MLVFTTVFAFLIPREMQGKGNTQLLGAATSASLFLTGMYSFP